MTAHCLTERERATLSALARVALPPGVLLPAAGPRTVAAAEAVVAGWPSALQAGWRTLLGGLDAQAVLMHQRPFAQLGLAQRLALVDRCQAGGDLLRTGLRGLLVPIKLAHFDDADIHAAVGCTYARETPRPEKARWKQAMTDLGTQDADVDLQAEVVVVGSGAGGAAVAKELAELGCAVVVLEEGAYFGRDQFTGRAVHMMERMYRNRGATYAVGNTFIPIPIGRTVGGTTTINSGTCLRAPEATLARWRAESGIDTLTLDELGPHYARVEKILQVAPSSAAALGVPGRVIARGCEALGWSNHPLPRNAPACDGQGLCCFGCPSGAKRSTDVSYIPLALQRGAQLFTGAVVEHVMLRGETAVGVSGHFTGRDGLKHTFRVEAKAVVLACGALHTPTLLLRQGLANASDQLGQNLSIHPASAAVGIFDEAIGGLRAVPQGWCVDQFHGDGILFEGASSPLPIVAASHTGYGAAFVRAMEAFDRSLMFGFLIRDSSRGRVRLGPGGDPLVTYVVNEADRSQLQRATGLLWQLLFAAGAREIHTGVHGWQIVTRPEQVAAFAQARVAVRHFELSAYHPLGTCRMGSDPRRSVVSATHETHDVHNLWICDGSALPGALGVNPQMTILALATRAAPHIARRLG